MKAAVYVEVYPWTNCRTNNPMYYTRDCLPAALVEGARRFLVTFELPDPIIHGVIKAKAEEIKEGDENLPQLVETVNAKEEIVCQQEKK